MDENNEKPDEETLERLKKMTRVEKKALELVAKNPNLSDNAISKELKELGFVRDRNYMLYRLSRNQIMNLEVRKIRERNAEILSRRIVPKALDLHEKALKEKVSKDILCSTKDKIVRPGTCGKCEDRKKCEDYKAYLKEKRDLNQSQFKFIKLAEDVEFKTDESKRQTFPTQINIETLQILQAKQLETCNSRLEQMKQEDEKQAQ